MPKHRLPERGALLFAKQCHGTPGVVQSYGLEVQGGRHVQEGELIPIELQGGVLAFPPGPSGVRQRKVEATKPKGKFADTEEKEWSCLVPINSPANFIENERENKDTKADPKKRRAQSEEPLPGWAGF